MNWRMLADAEANSVVYPDYMAEVIEELTALAVEIRELDAQREELLERRKRLALEGREKQVTWRAMALALGMTEHGLIKATKS